MTLTEPSWVVVETRAMCEDIVERALLNVGYRAYVPRYRRLMQPHGRERKLTAIMRPAFPGVVFVQDWRGWPTAIITGVMGLMKSGRSGTARLSGADIALIADRERSGMFEPQAPRPPANGVVLREDIAIGDAVTFDLSGVQVTGVLDQLSPDGKAVVNAIMFGRVTPYRDIDADTLVQIDA